MTATDITAASAQRPGTLPHALALDAFAEVSAALGATSVDQVLAVVARKVRQLVGVARCSIYLRDGDAGLFRGRVTDGGARELAPYVRRSLAGMPADGMTLELLETGRPVIIADAQNDPRMIRSNTRFWNIRSIMAVPMVVGERVIGVIYLDDVDRPHQFFPADAELASTFARLAAVAVEQAQVCTDLAGKLETAECRVKALRRAAAVDERLSELVLEGAGLDALVQAIAQLHGKPCGVYDAAHTRLSVAAPGEADEGLMPLLLEQPAVGSLEVSEALAGNADARVFVVPPVPGVGMARRHLVAPIYVEGAPWGHLVMMEHRSRFNAADTITLRRAATLLALQAAGERRAVEADWNGGASLVAELLSPGCDPVTVARRAARLGVRLDTLHAVAVFGSRDGTGVADFRAIAAAFGELAPGLQVQTTALGQMVGALIAMPAVSDPERFLGELKDIIASVCARSAGELIAGVSSLRDNLEQYVDAHDEARQIVDCIRRFGVPRGPSVFLARELGLGRVFLATADPDSVKSFATVTFGGIVGDESKRDLLATLSCFFENMASVRRCALHLAVHENTIRYRLARIEELTGLAITHDPDAQLGARLSLLVLMLSGCLDPSDLSQRNLREAAAEHNALTVTG
jgi:sugar diacid utilization regulator